MPRPTAVVLSNVAKARNYAREHKMSYDALYHLFLAALDADGNFPSRVDPNAPTEADLSTDDKSALATAKSAIGI